MEKGSLVGCLQKDPLPVRVVFLKLPMRGGQRRLHGRLPDFHPRPAALRRHHLERRRPREHAAAGRE